MRRRTTVKGALLLVLIVVMINLPLVQSRYTSWRVEHSGVDVTATVTGSGVLPPKDEPHYVLAFTLPEDIDPDQTRWSVEVDRATYERAVDSKEVDVRVLPDRPVAHTVEGQVKHSLGLVITLLADLVLLGLVLLLWRFRGHLRAPLQAVAVGDVEACEPGSALDRVEGDLYLIRGQVSEIGDDELVLDLGDRSVHVRLDGHHNPVAHQQPAQVSGRLIG